MTLFLFPPNRNLRVILWLAVSSMIAWLAVTTEGRAHEILASVADVTIGTERIEMTIEASIEPIIAGADLAGLQDTDESNAVEEIDRLRALPPDALADEVRDAWPRLADRLDVMAGDTQVEMRLDRVDVEDIGDVDLPRLSRLSLSGDMPPGDPAVTIAWPADLGALALRQMGAGPDGYSTMITDGGVSDPMSRSGAATQSALGAFLDYIPVGFDHIVPKGLDHILFVLGLFFLSMQLRPLLWQVTAFTLAHTVTLALASLGIVTIPGSIVEPLIAASIVYVGVENVLSRGLTPWRPFIVFCFGLLHGLGFASVLQDFGLGGSNFVAKLIGFNIGVELGQLAVIAAAFLLVGYWFGAKPWYRRVIANPASLVIAAVGAFWFLERTVL